MGIVEKNGDQGSAAKIVAAFGPTLTSEYTLPKPSRIVPCRLRYCLISIDLYAVETEPYLHDCQPLTPKDYAKDKVLAERLWHISEDLVGEKFSLSTI